MDIIADTNVKAYDRAFAVGKLIEVEAFKREIRGIPRLLGHKLDEVAKGRLALAKRIPSTPAEIYTEIEPAEPESKPVTTWEGDAEGT